MLAIPTLNVDGFTSNKSIMMIKLYEHFLSSEYSQSNIFLGKIASAKYILSEAKGAAELKDMFTLAIDAIYTNYFKSVTTDITITESDNSINITVNVRTVDENNESFRLNEIINVTDNKITNYGTHQEDYYV